MKRLLALLIASAFCVSGAFAQSKPLRGTDSRQKTQVRTRSMDERVDAFARLLSLKPVQKAKVKAVLEKQMAKQRALALDKKLSDDARRKKILALTNETNVLVRKELDKNQQKKFDELLKKADAKRAKVGPPQRRPIKP